MEVTRTEFYLKTNQTIKYCDNVSLLLIVGKESTKLISRTHKIKNLSSNIRAILRTSIYH